MLAKKMRILPGTTIVALHAPDNYPDSLGELPEGVVLKYKAAKQNDFIQLFVRNRAELEATIVKACASLAPGGLIWITYPKGSSGMQTDLTRDKGWESLEQLPHMERLTLISFDDKWSAFLMRNAPGKKTPARSWTDFAGNDHPYINAKTKTVLIPEDLEKAFAGNKTAAGYFQSLAYSHRKEYVLWIADAKKPETRERRIQQTIDMLQQQRKNPSDKG